MMDIFGYINGEPVYSRNEFIYKGRGFGPITTEEELVEFALKVSYKKRLTDMWLGDYCLDHPKADLTNSEYEWLKALQAKEIARLKAIDEAREWKLVRTECFADNSEEEVWVDKDGIEKRVMTVYPHGD